MNKFIKTSIAVALCCVSTAHAEVTKVIGLSWNSKENEIVNKWEEYTKSEADRQGAAVGIKFKWIINVADNDPTRQAANIEDLINQGVDVIIARGEDVAAIGSSIRAAKRAHIPFISFDHGSTTTQPDAYVSGNSYDQGKTTAEAFVALMKKNNIKGQCIELQGPLKDVNAVQRSKAWHDITDKSGVVTTLQTVPTEWNPQLFRSGTVNAFRAHPEANCMFLGSDFAFTAVKSALESLNKWQPEGQPGHIWIASQDLFPDAVKAMEGKYIDVATTYDAYAHAKEAIRVAIALTEKKDPACSSEGCLAPGRVATPENVDTLDHLWSRQ
ncbi:sugar ABC transporter substrate-binding protein [Klebsiella michiganensis]|uniref:sugar ABC transporter substrate-binding protein n=1 Tax=Klebsiella michiganensis TaxID=1134687 RepID=UPI0021C7DB1F|nr:sugar ABC transporter substrate-binding protein [Klebsiella michiganensis]UXO81803.1 sugar ABC transporter substrate-binding protein [Klebsiella michiganensis]